ncbi:MAG: phospholipase D-like domain-containing protein [Candidatus Micrarchaeaceae archaeon]
MEPGGSVQYSGSESFKYADRLIGNNDRELLIISPYISNYYVRILMRKRHKKIRIITSESSMGSGSLLMDIAKGSRRRRIKALAYFAVLDAILFYIHLGVAALALLILVALLFAGTIKKPKAPKSNIQVKTTGSRFIHEKIYIGDSTAITGSANLTYNGMHKNIEHIEVITDKRRIGELKDHFNRLWKEY